MDQIEKEMQDKQVEANMKLSAMRMAIDVFSLTSNKRGLAEIYREIRDVLREE